MRILCAPIQHALFVVVVVFCVQNLECGTVDFLGWSLRLPLPLPLLVLTPYGLGLVSGSGVLNVIRRMTQHQTRN